MTSKITTESTSTKWLEQMGSTIAILDTNFNFVAATDSWYDNFNYEKNTANLIGKSILSIFPDNSEDLNTRLDYALDGLKDIQMMFRDSNRQRNSGECIWYLNPWKDGYGNTIGVVINVKEVSERKSLEFDLKRTKHLLEQKSEIAKIGSWEYDLLNDKLFWSDKVKDIHGVYKEYEPDFNNSLTYYKEGNSDLTINRCFQEAIDNGKPWNETVQLVTANGNIKWVNSIGRPKFKDGQCTRILGTIQEVAQIEGINAPSDTSNGLNYEKFFENGPAAMAICDYDTGKILGTNKALNAILGTKGIALKEQQLNTFLSLGKSQKLKLTRELLSKKAFTSFKTSLVRKDAEAIVIELNGSLIEDEAGRKLILTTIDRPQNTAALERSDSQALDADEEIEKLVNFNHMMAHNLKMHATNISLLSNLLDKEENLEERNKMMTLLSQSTDFLMNEIKGFREMVAIGENKGLKKVTLPLNDFVFNAEQKLSGLIKKKNVKIFNGVKDSLKVNVVPVYMESIINNIVTNSIKFKKKDKNPVVVFNAEETQDYAILSIEDNGIGMDLNKHKDKVFGLYRTINNSKSSGLGLYLAKYQMELMKGKIEAESTEGLGTTFKLFFPR